MLPAEWGVLSWALLGDDDGFFFILVLCLPFFISFAVNLIPQTPRAFFYHLLSDFSRYSAISSSSFQLSAVYPSPYSLLVFFFSYRSSNAPTNAESVW